MEKKIPFDPIVMLIDASYLERVGTDLVRHFAPLIKRDLPKADLAVLLECLALDAGISLSNNKVQVLFIYDEADKYLSFCTPSDLERELHATAFKSQLGEFSLYSFQPSGIASREDLFLESFQLLGESKEVGKIMVVPDEDGYGERLGSYINKVEDSKKDVSVFGMNPPAYQGKFAFEMLGFAILQALGIRADEL